MLVLLEMLVREMLAIQELLVVLAVEAAPRPATAAQRQGPKRER